MKIKIKREYKPGEIIGRYYGIAYLEVDRYVAVAYPLPLNILVGVARRIWIWLRTSQAQLDDVKALAWKEGYYEGLEKGKEEATRKVIEQTREYFSALNKEIKKVFPRVRRPLKKLRGII